MIFVNTTSLIKTDEITTKTIQWMSIYIVFERVKLLLDTSLLILKFITNRIILTKMKRKEMVYVLFAARLSICSLIAPIRKDREM